VDALLHVMLGTGIDHEDKEEKEGEEAMEEGPRRRGGRGRGTTRMDDEEEDMHPEGKAPGNIYRLLAILHPGKVGWLLWSEWAFKAVVCAYMQVYLPAGIILEIFRSWKPYGVKSPIWFFFQGSYFISVFAALASLLHVFAGACENHIRIGAKANYYILSHDEPLPPPLFKDEEEELHTYLPRYTCTTKAAMAISPFSSRPLKSMSTIAYEAMPAGGRRVLESAGNIMGSMDGGSEAMLTELQCEVAPKPTLTLYFIRTNEKLWLILGMSLNILMSFMCQIIMILKVATYEGNLEGLAMISVSLYFIFDLDQKIFESDPRLRARYRKAIGRQTVETVFLPKWIYQVAMLAIYSLRLMIPFGLWVIVVVAWRNQGGTVIGGDMFTPLTGPAA